MIENHTHTHTPEITKPKLNESSTQLRLVRPQKRLWPSSQRASVAERWLDWPTVVLTDCGQNSLPLQILQKPMSLWAYCQSPSQEISSWKWGALELELHELHTKPSAACTPLSAHSLWHLHQGPFLVFSFLFWNNFTLVKSCKNSKNSSHVFFT